jgi:hypothetical protein
MNGHFTIPPILHRSKWKHILFFLLTAQLRLEPVAFFIKLYSQIEGYFQIAVEAEIKRLRPDPWRTVERMERTKQCRGGETNTKEY